MKLFAITFLVIIVGLINYYVGVHFGRKYERKRLYK